MTRSEQRRKLLQEVRDNPEKHRHGNMADLIRCCKIDGIVDSELIQAHQGIFGSNGGSGCDVENGPRD